MARPIHFWENCETSFGHWRQLRMRNALVSQHIQTVTLCLECWEGPKYISMFVTRPSLHRDHWMSAQSLSTYGQAIANYEMYSVPGTQTHHEWQNFSVTNTVSNLPILNFSARRQETSTFWTSLRGWQQHCLWLVLSVAPCAACNGACGLHQGHLMAVDELLLIKLQLWMNSIFSWRWYWAPGSVHEYTVLALISYACSHFLPMYYSGLKAQCFSPVFRLTRRQDHFPTSRPLPFPAASSRLHRHTQCVLVCLHVLSRGLWGIVTCSCCFKTLTCLRCLKWWSRVTPVDVYPVHVVTVTIYPLYQMLP